MNKIYFNEKTNKLEMDINCSVGEILLLEAIIKKLLKKYNEDYLNENHKIIWEEYKRIIDENNLNECSDNNGTQ